MSSINFGFKHEVMWTKIGKNIRQEKFDVKLLGVISGKSLIFDEHVSKHVLILIGNLVSCLKCRDFFLQKNNDNNNNNNNNNNDNNNVNIQTSQVLQLQYLI